MRAHRPDCKLEQAARFIYLNRTCFNGIYRVNKQGNFNVPLGSKNTVVFDHDDFEAVARSLSSTQLTALDFEAVVDRCGEGDCLFVDPPYTVKHNLNGFVKYNETLFAWSDQIRLRDALIRARTRGAEVMICNAHHQSVLSLYKEAANIHVLGRYSVIAASSKMRRSTTEIMIRL
jgi:DNA adenine methylase